MQCRVSSQAGDASDEQVALVNLMKSKALAHSLDLCSRAASALTGCEHAWCHETSGHEGSAGCGFRPPRRDLSSGVLVRIPAVQANRSEHVSEGARQSLRLGI